MVVLVKAARTGIAVSSGNSGTAQCALTLTATNSNNGNAWITDSNIDVIAQRQL